MLPRRFNIFRPYVASFIYSRFQRPPIIEVVKWITQPSKENRASVFINKKTLTEDFVEILFYGYKTRFFYPCTASWIDLCQTIDECFNPKNWHYFFLNETPLTADDIVVDCGAAEGLFSFIAAHHAKKVYAIEPIPFWHKTLDKNFQQFDNIELIKMGAGHKQAVMNMTNDEIYSQICENGDVEVPINTLDSLFTSSNERISFIKADVEGFEFPLLLGAEEIIRKHHPKISFTVYHNANNYFEIMNYLKLIHHDYQFRIKGIAENGNPVLIHAY